VSPRSRDEYVNLSAHGGPHAGPGVEFGDYHVPSAVAWSRPATRTRPAVKAEFEMRRGRPVCTSVHFDADGCAEGVRTADLVALPGLERKGAEAFLVFGTPVIDDEAWRAGLNLHRTGEIFNPNKKALREALKMQSNEELRHIAQVYRENLERDPAGAVARALDVSPATAGRRIKEARDRGFLPKTTPGKKKG
jgi:hypothetical protein